MMVDDAEESDVEGTNPEIEEIAAKEGAASDAVSASRNIASIAIRCNRVLEMTVT